MKPHRRYPIFNLFVCAGLSALLAYSSPMLAQPVAASALPAGVTVVQTVEGITEYRLTNGMKVLLAHDAADERVTVNVTYMVGSRHEGYGETGMAHLLEHLIFKGTPKLDDPKAEFRKRGFNFNGTTNVDRTNYYATFQSNQESLDWYVAWQADAMVNSFIAKKDLDSEMTVVRSEYELSESNAVQALVARMASSAYMWHNYAKSTIGAKADIENVDIANLQAFYKRHYRPDNAVMIIAGKFDAAKTLVSIQAAFGPIAKPSAAIAPTYTLDTAQDGERSVVVRRPSAQQFLIAGYHVPPALHPDSEALSVLSLVLSDAPAGRLHKALVETKLAQFVFAAPFSRREGGTYFFGTGVGPGDDASTRQKILLDLVEGMATSPVTQEEFDRAKAKLNKSIELAFANAASVANGAINSEVMGDWRAVFVSRDRMAKVTLDDVNRVAKTYLLRDNRTFGHLIPTEKPVRAPDQILPNVAAYMAGFALKAEGEASLAFDFSLPSLERNAVLHTTAGGIKTAVLNKPIRGDLVNFSIRLKTGNLQSLKGSEFSSVLASQLYMRGTDQMTRQQIDDATVKLGAQINIGVGGQGGAARFTVKRAQFAPTLELVAHLLKNSTFPDAQLEEVRAGLIKGYEGALKDKASMAQEAWSRYGNPYPKTDYRYQISYEESLPLLKAVKAEEVRHFHKNFVGAANAQVTVVGAIDPKQVQAQVAALFDNWKAPVTYTRVPYPLVIKTPTRLSFDTPDKANASLEAYVGMPINDFDPDQLAMALATRAFGSGPGSRLWERMREKSGLSYSADAGFSANSHEKSASMSMSAEVNPANLSKAEAAMREELAASLQSGFTDAEVSRFKGEWLGDRLRQRSGDGWAAQAMGFQLEFDKPWDLRTKNDAIIAALTTAQVNEVWRKYVKPEAFVWGVFADQSKVK